MCTNFVESPVLNIFLNPLTMSALNLRFLGEDDPSVKEVHGRYSDWDALEVLKRYLEPNGDLSIDQATAMINDMLPNPDEADLRYQVPSFYDLVLEQAQQIPYSHPAQLRFVRLLKRLQISFKLSELQVWPLGDDKVSVHGLHTKLELAKD